LLNFITKFLRPLGHTIILIFSLLTILNSIISRQIQERAELSLFQTILKYTISHEDRFYDFRMKSQLDPKFKSKEIVLIDIDDYSLKKLGTWPIPRTIHAKMIDKLRHFGAKVVALDILYPERSPNFEGVNPDKKLFNSFKTFQENGKIFLSYSLTSEKSESLNSEEWPEEIYDNTLTIRNNSPKAHLRPSYLNRDSLPITELLESGVGMGYISTLEDFSGVFRHYQIVANVDSTYFNSLALNAVSTYIEKTPTLFLSLSDDISGILQLGDTKIQITEKGEFKVRYIGGKDQFHSISLFDLVNADPNDKKIMNLINGKIIFVGSSALGAHDLRPSPIDPKMPGVYSHLNVAHMLIENYFFQDEGKSVIISCIILLLGLAFFLIVQRSGNALLDSTVVIFLILTTYLADKIYFLPQGYEIRLFYIYFCLMSCYSWNTFLKFYQANNEKKQIRGTFARYVAPTIVDEMLKDPDKLHVGGTKMDITCLFSDVRDFTKISEGLSATELAHSLNIYMGAMTDIVFDTKGTLDKYIGDAIVALWGAPLSIGNHAQYAVEAAIKMINTLPGINEEFRKLGRPTFNVGIGLNSGECSVGNMGSSRIFSYTALGDNMNLGARLESLCKYYGAQILISDMTLDRLDLAQIKTRPLDKVVVKGKTQAVGIHEVLHAHHWLTKNSEAFEKYLNGYKLFLMKDFNAALEIFNELLKEQDSDKPSKRLRDLCKNFLEKPESVTADFEVTVMTEK
jgi:adenylate cyclase